MLEAMVRRLIRMAHVEGICRQRCFETGAVGKDKKMLKLE